MSFRCALSTEYRGLDSDRKAPRVVRGEGTVLVSVICKLCSDEGTYRPFVGSAHRNIFESCILRTRVYLSLKPVTTSVVTGVETRVELTHGELALMFKTIQLPDSQMVSGFLKTFAGSVCDDRSRADGARAV